MSPIMQRACAAFISTLLLFVSVETARAQSEPVLELFRTIWDDDAAAALQQYRELPESRRSADLLVQVADQLLWTGKHGEALELLAVAREEAPRLADIQFQSGRAYLQRGELDAARAAFARGLDVVEEDPTLDSEGRERLQRRLENRVRFLDHRDALLEMTGAYETNDGRVLLLKFDPYVNTFPTLLDLSDGTVRILYPESNGDLYYRGADDRAFGVTVADGEAGGSMLRVETEDGVAMAPDLGISRETVRFEAKGASIEGTLLLPAGVSPPYPAVVLTHGAGLSTRYNLVNEALAFATAGLAALVFDKPGLGNSIGENWLLLSIEEQAEHVGAAVALLQGRSDIEDVGVWGFSQGGWVAPLAASRNPEIGFVVMASGAAVGPQEQSVQSNVLAMENAELSAEDVEAGRAYMRELWNRVNTGLEPSEMEDLYATAVSTAWGDFVPRLRLRFEFDWWAANEVDAAATLEKLEVPVLAMLGETDAAVPPRDNVPLLARRFSRAPTSDFAIIVLPDANHQFMRDDDYQPLYFSTMIHWVADRFAYRHR